jgi:hypothetical protein
MPPAILLGTDLPAIQQPGLLIKIVAGSKISHYTWDLSARYTRFRGQPFRETLGGTYGEAVMNNWWKYGLVFLGGAVAGVLVYKNSKALRNVCTKAMGGIMDIKDMAVEAAETVKESAEDLLAEADAQRKTRESAT